MEAAWPIAPDSMEKCSLRLGPCAYQSSGTEEESDTS